MLSAVLAVTLAAATPLAQSKDQSKDFAGTWALDAAKTGGTEGPPVVVIAMTAADFTARFGSETAPAMAFKLDGTETNLPNGGKTKAAWRGTKLDATVTTQRGADTVTFSRDGAWLVVEMNSPQHGAKKFFFKKATAK
jgi:hypothetical protein